MNTPMIIGRQTFDGLGRQLTVEVGGHTTRFHYVNGQLAPSGNTLADGRKIAFTYEKHLNHQLLSVVGQDETLLRMTYHEKIGQLASATGERDTQAFAYTPTGQALRDEWTVDDATHTTQWKYSLSGLLQGFDDAQGIPHRREFDSAGRVQRTSVGNVETRYTYDGLSRLITVQVSDPDSQHTLTTTIAYDLLGREHIRTFVVTPAPDSEDDAPRTVTQTLGYSAQDQIVSRTWSEGDQHGEETFAYDVRNRLVHYTANEHAAPQDPYGNRIVEQAFVFNALNGYQTVVSTFVDGSQDEAAFSYAEGDPTRLLHVTHTHEAWPSTLALTYDECGRVSGDSLGRRMKWDTQGRLTEVSHEGRTCTYRYDSKGQLVERTLDDSLTRSFFSADQLTHEQTGSDSLQLIGDSGALFAVNKVTDGVRQTLLIGTDAQGSVRIEADSALRTVAYTPHGAQAADDGQIPFGFAAERREPLTGWYIPGGHRPYDPVLMCFLAPDSESPFGRGGINPYAYCAGDPVNRIDPDAHSWSQILAGTGLVLGAIGLVATGFALGPAVSVLLSTPSLLTTVQAVALTGAALDVVSLGTGAASFILQAQGHDGNAAGILGLVSTVTGLASAAIGVKVALLRRGGLPQRVVNPKAPMIGNASELVKDSAGTVHVGFINSYRGTNQAAMLTHGDPLRALLQGPDGKVIRAADLARDFIAPRLAALKYADDQPFVLLSCWGGKNGAALEIAKELGRPVQGFTEKVFVKGFTNLQLKGNSANTPREAISYIERLRASGNPITAWKTTFQEAGSKLFHPDGTITAVV